MSRNVYLVVFPGGDHWPISEATEVAGAIDVGDSIYFVDGNVGFIATAKPVEMLTDRLKKVLGSDEQFFLADITNCDRSGNMVPRFWEFLRDKEVAVA